MIGPAQRESLPEGHRVGRYTIVRPLGRGGMGVVYVARDERLGREVALKLIDGVNEEATVERFWREARAAASVSHPHICQVYEVEELPEGICLAMELLVGEALDARLARGALAPSEATRIAVQMLGALGALHDRGLVHRDIKPSNVFCTPHGAKVLDFGLTRASAMAMAEIDGGVAPQVTRTGMIMGTPRPWPPNSSRASHSTTAPTCTPWARCCSRCSLGGRPSRGRRRSTRCTRRCTRTRPRCRGRRS